MDTIKHTPGPWSLMYPDNEYDGFVAGPADQLVAVGMGDNSRANALELVSYAQHPIGSPLVSPDAALSPAEQFSRQADEVRDIIEELEDAD